jgi:hypothetical protein
MEYRFVSGMVWNNYPVGGIIILTQSNRLSWFSSVGAIDGYDFGHSCNPNATKRNSKFCDESLVLNFGTETK